MKKKFVFWSTPKDIEKTSFSGFFRDASSKDRKRVFKAAAKKATKEQNEIVCS